jgi:hypothetical protein
MKREMVKNDPDPVLLSLLVFANVMITGTDFIEIYCFVCFI